MRLIPNVDGARMQSVVSLDQAWREAESIGRVTVDCTWSGAVIYTVKIKFDSNSSTVWATGNHPTILDALLSAIAEARRISRAR